jgi:hypothetical protein
MKRWRTGAVLAGLLILMASLLLAGCPQNDHQGGGMRDSPRKGRSY